MEYPCRRCQIAFTAARRGYCDACRVLALEEQKQKARDRATKWRWENIDAVRERDRERSRGPEAYAKRRVAKLKWSARHPGYLKEYYQLHGEEIRERIARWKRENVSRVKVNNQRRRAWKKGSGGVVRHDEWLEIVRRQGGRCYDCGVESKLTMGHGIPLYVGGKHEASNIIGQCSTCNSKQGRRIHPHFLDNEEH